MDLSEMNLKLKVHSKGDMLKCPNCNKNMEDFVGLLWMCFDCELMLSENEINNWNNEKQYWRYNPKLKLKGGKE